MCHYNFNFKLNTFIGYKINISISNWMLEQTFNKCIKGLYYLLLLIERSLKQF